MQVLTCLDLYLNSLQRLSIMVGDVSAGILAAPMDEKRANKVLCDAGESAAETYNLKQQGYSDEALSRARDSAPLTTFGR